MQRSDNSALSAPASRGITDAAAGVTDDYRILLPRFPDGKMCMNSVFLHADLAGRPYRAVDFRDGLKEIVDGCDVVSLGQYQMSHVWMLTLTSMAATEKVKAAGQLKVKGKKCLVIDPNSKDIKVKLLWLPTYLEDRRVAEALEPYGKLRTITREKWRVQGMETMETLNREVSLTLHDAVTSAELPHMLKVYGVQSLLLVPGRPPLCLRCKRVGHIRRQCRAPKCVKCHRFGHESSECYSTYASALRGSSDEDTNQEHFMDVSEVVDATGEVPSTPQAESTPLAPESTAMTSNTPDAESAAASSSRAEGTKATEDSSFSSSPTSKEQQLKALPPKDSSARPNRDDRRDCDQMDTSAADANAPKEGNEGKRKQVLPPATTACKRLITVKQSVRQVQESHPP
ncbi:uncharacterized protein ISCGN_021910 [Ixodes scapularis]